MEINLLWFLLNGDKLWTRTHSSYVLGFRKNIFKKIILAGASCSIYDLASLANRATYPSWTNSFGVHIVVFIPHDLVEINAMTNKHGTFETFGRLGIRLLIYV